MIWFNIRKLEEKISNNELTDKDGFNYLLAFFISISLIFTEIGSDNNVFWIKLLDLFLPIIVTIWGLHTAYNANIKIDGKDFFKRFFAINWVITMRMLGFVLIFLLISEIINGSASLSFREGLHDKSQFLDIIGLVFTTIFEVVFYLLIINSFRKIKPKKEENIFL